MMPDLSFSGLAIVAAAAFAVPLLLGLVPRLRLPSAVLEILVGIAIGPSGLGWVTADVPIQIVALIGVAYVLFLSGLEVDVDRLRGGLLRVAGGNFLVSFGVAVAVAYGLAAAGLVQSPLLVAIILGATSLGIVVPLLKDTGYATSELGQLVIGSASVADFGTVILLSLFFSREASTVGTQVVLLGTFALLAVVATLALSRVERSMRLSSALVRLQDTTAQIRVRGAILLLLGFVAFAAGLGLEVVFGAFTAGAILQLVDRDKMMTHPNFRIKLEAIGFGVFIPIFFVTSGIRFDLQALFASPATLALVPVFLAALFVVRGLPAWLYRARLGTPHTVIAMLLQAISLPFIVVAAQVGMDLGMLSKGTGAGLVAAGLLSVILFPPAALAVLRGLDRVAPPLAAPSHGMG